MVTLKVIFVHVADTHLSVGTLSVFVSLFLCLSVLPSVPVMEVTNGNEE